MKNIKVGIPGTLHEKDVNPASACMYVCININWLQIAANE